MSKVVHVYFGDHKKHPIINNYLKTIDYAYRVIDVSKSKGGRFKRLFLMANLLIKARKNKDCIFHVHDLLSFYLVKLVFPLRATLFDSHEVYRSYFTGVSYPFVYILEELSTLLATYKFLPSWERSQLYYFKKNTFIVENLFLPPNEVDLGFKNKQKKSFVYAGLLSERRCIKELISLFEKKPDCTLTIYGQENRYLKGILKHGLPENVSYCGELTQQELFENLPKFTASFALYKPLDLNNKYPAPTKIFENEFYGLTTIVFQSSYIDRLIESGVLRNTYTIKTLDKEEFQKILLKDGLEISQPNPLHRILWTSQEQLISKIYESMLLRHE